MTRLPTATFAPNSFVTTPADKPAVVLDSWYGDGAWQYRVRLAGTSKALNYTEAELSARRAA
jgi:hypothetical protein